VKDLVVAGRYARALFIVTEKRGETARALADLKGIVEVLAPDRGVASHLYSPHLRLSDKREALKKALDGRVVRVVQVFADLLLRKRRLPELADIAIAFEALVEKAQGIRRAHVVSAVPMADAEVERLKKALEHNTAGEIRITREVDPELLGGALVRIGDRVIDRSARTLLEAIHKQLSEVSV